MSHENLEWWWKLEFMRGLRKIPFTIIHTWLSLVKVQKNWEKNFQIGVWNNLTKVFSATTSDSHEEIGGTKLCPVIKIENVNPILLGWSNTPDFIRGWTKLSYTLATWNHQRKSAKSLHKSSLQEGHLSNAKKSPCLVFLWCHHYTIWLFIVTKIAII